MRKHGKSGNGIFCLFLLLFGLGYCLCLKVGHLLRLLLFCVSALPEVNRSIAGRKVSTLERNVPFQNVLPRASTKYCFCSFSCCWFSNQNEMCRRTEPRTTTCRAGVTCFFPGTLPQTKSCCRSPADGPGYSAAGGSAQVCSLHRHVAVGVVHERRRVQGGCHVLVAEL